MSSKILIRLSKKMDELEKLDKIKMKNDDIDEIKLVNIDEYQFDLEEMKNPTDNHCLKCHKKFTSCYGLAICRLCMRSLTINKTEAMKIYNLKNNDLENIDCYQYKNGFGGYTHYYFTKEIRLKAIELRFDLINPCIGDYTDCIEAILEETNERQKKSKERGLKMIDARERNKELKIKKELLAYGERKSRLKKALDKKNLVIDEDCDACREYLNGNCTNLKLVIKQTKNYLTKKSKLESELAKKNLVIRNDSYYCQQYLKGYQFTVKEVVEMMVIMDFFANKTDYFRLIRACIQGQYDDAKDHGYWDGERIELCEEEKDEIKILALKKYLEKKHSSKDVPRCVLERYNI